MSNMCLCVQVVASCIIIAFKATETGSFKNVRAAASDSIRGLSNALMGGLGFGLQVYVPEVKLQPGKRSNENDSQ